jgi:hypothetical protein
MSESSLLKRILGLGKREEATGGRRYLHSQKRYVLFSSPDIFRVSECKWTRWTRHAASMRGMRSA